MHPRSIIKKIARLAEALVNLRDQGQVYYLWPLTGTINLIKAINLAMENGTKLLWVVGRKAGFTHQVGDHVAVIPQADSGLIIPTITGLKQNGCQRRSWLSNHGV